MNTPLRLSGGISRKLLVSLGILGSVGAIAGLGTYAQFTDSTSASHSVTTGTVDIDLAASGAANRLSESSTLLAAGDTIERAVDLNIAGDLALSSITLAASASTSSNLDTDATDGLQLQVDRCSTAWSEAGAASARTYTCGGTQAIASAAGPVIRSAAALTNLALTAGGTEHLRLKWTLPASATQADHGGRATVVDYDFVGVQRAATQK